MGKFLAWAIVLVVVVAPVAAVSDILISARSYDESPTDAITVLGASQYWGEPSPVFRNRLDHARDLWAEGVAPRIITVGGKQPGDRTTEAEAGRDYLIRSGVPAEDVIALPDGSDTWESIRDVDAVMKDNGWRAITIVSDRTHLARSKAMARALGLEVHVSGRAFDDGAKLTPEKIVRETGGLLYFQFVQRWSGLT